VTPTIRHLRPRGEGIAQPTTTVELFFDLVYVFAVTQPSHQILGDLSVAGVAREAFQLLIVWQRPPISGHPTTPHQRPRQDSNLRPADQKKAPG